MCSLLETLNVFLSAHYQPSNRFQRFMIASKIENREGSLSTEERLISLRTGGIQMGLALTESGSEENLNQDLQ